MAMNNNIVQGEWDWMKNDPYLKAIKAEQEQKDANQWNKMMQMLPLAGRTDESTMIGYALGKLLGDGFRSWKRNYEERGERKAGDKGNPKNWNESDVPAIKNANPFLNFPKLETPPEGMESVYNVPNRQPTSVEVMKLAGFGNPTPTEVKAYNDSLLGTWGDDPRGYMVDDEYWKGVM